MHSSAKLQSLPLSVKFPFVCVLLGLSKTESRLFVFTRLDCYLTNEL